LTKKFLAGREKDIFPLLSLVVFYNGTSLVLLVLIVRHHSKMKVMKRMILVMCLGLFAVASRAQLNERDRLVSTNPLRNGDGSFVKANNPLFLNNSSADSTWSKKRLATTTSSGNPFAFRVNSIQAMCDLNAITLSWTSIQRQPDADHFDVEQSSDAGVTWTNIGSVPASRFKTGSATYNFVYNKSPDNIDFRVVAINTAGEKRYSAIIHSACSNSNNLLSVNNLVYSTAHVRIGSTKTQNAKIILINSSGVPEQVREIGLTQGVNSVTLDMSTLRTGVYTLTVVWPGDLLQSMKVVKQ